MEEQANINFRAAIELLARIDAHAERMRIRSPGASIGRSDAIRSLLLAGLERAERAEAQP